MNYVMTTYNRFSRIPMGKTILSKLVCLKAPYFGTIKPYFSKLEPGVCEITMKKRRRVQNHIGSVHAIAMCNLCELCAGTLIEASLPSHLRWIPKGMTVEYLKVARTHLTAVCSLPDQSIDATGELPLTVDVLNTAGETVMRAVIAMHISEKPTKAGN